MKIVLKESFLGNYFLLVGLLFFPVSLPDFQYSYPMILKITKENMVLMNFMFIAVKYLTNLNFFKLWTSCKA